jgi:hypothetical protein
MSIKELKFNSDVKLSAYINDDKVIDLSLEYVSKSPDPWYSDSQEDCSISEQKAKEIVEFLTSLYPNIKT